jgi:hypothetical protein
VRTKGTFVVRVGKTAIRSLLGVCPLFLNRPEEVSRKLSGIRSMHAIQTIDDAFRLLDHLDERRVILARFGL